MKAGRRGADQLHPTAPQQHESRGLWLKSSRLSASVRDSRDGEEGREPCRSVCVGGGGGGGGSRRVGGDGA